MKRRILLAITILAVSAGIATAQRGTASNTGRQVSQQSRIADGVRSGELTRRETVALEREQRRIQIEKRLAQADGKVTPAEKRWLRREQNRANRHIARQKNDAQQR